MNIPYPQSHDAEKTTRLIAMFRARCFVSAICFAGAALVLTFSADHGWGWLCLIFTGLIVLPSIPALIVLPQTPASTKEDDAGQAAK